MGYSKGRERLYNIIDATRIWDIVKGGKDYITKLMQQGRERLYNIIDATRIRDIIIGGKDYIT